MTDLRSHPITRVTERDEQEEDEKEGGAVASSNMSIGGRPEDADGKE